MDNMNGFETGSWPLRLATASILLAISLAGCCPLPEEQNPPETMPGPFGTVSHDVTVIRPDRSTFSALVITPVQINKDGIPYSRIAYPLPAIAFGHGYLAWVELYTSTLEHLASNGYVVIAARSAGELFPDHQAFADDLGHCLSFMIAENGDPGSFWFEQIDADRLGIMGQSMGGAAAVLCAGADVRVKAVAALSAAETRPSAIQAAAELTVPFCSLVGTEDGIAPAEIHAIPIYQAAVCPKLLFLIEGGYHCGFVDINPPLVCDSGSITRDQQLAVTWERVTAFFDTYLLEVASAREALLAPEPGLIIEAKDLPPVR